MKIIDIPTLVRSLTEVCCPVPQDGNDAKADAGGIPHELLAIMVRNVLDVHEHALLRWDSSKASAIDTDVAQAEFAICKSCGPVEREYFWCWTVRTLYVALAEAYDPPSDAGPGLWQGWKDMSDAVKRARAAYPPPVATAVVRALNNTSYSRGFRTDLLDAVITCTQAVPAQPAKAEKG